MGVNVHPFDHAICGHPVSPYVATIVAHIQPQAPIIDHKFWATKHVTGLPRFRRTLGVHVILWAVTRNCERPNFGHPYTNMGVQKRHSLVAHALYVLCHNFLWAYTYCMWLHMNCKMDVHKASWSRTCYVLTPTHTQWKSTQHIWVRTCSVWAYTYCVMAAHTSCMGSHIWQMGLNVLCVDAQHLYVGLHNVIVGTHLRHDERPKSHVLGYHTSGWAPSNPNSLHVHT